MFQPIRCRKFNYDTKITKAKCTKKGEKSSMIHKRSKYRNKAKRKRMTEEICYRNICTNEIGEIIARIIYSRQGRFFFL